jgi:hypothetical protein
MLCLFSDYAGLLQSRRGGGILITSLEMPAGLKAPESLWLSSHDVCDEITLLSGTRGINSVILRVVSKTESC